MASLAPVTPQPLIAITAFSISLLRLASRVLSCWDQTSVEPSSCIPTASTSCCGNFFCEPAMSISTRPMATATEWPQLPPPAEWTEWKITSKKQDLIGKSLEELSPIEWIERLFLVPVMDQHSDSSASGEAEESAETETIIDRDASNEKDNTMWKQAVGINLPIFFVLFLTIAIWLVIILGRNERFDYQKDELERLLHRVSKKEEEISEKARTIEQERRLLSTISHDILDSGYPKEQLRNKVRELKRELASLGARSTKELKTLQENLEFQKSLTEKERKEKIQHVDGLQKRLRQKEEELKSSEEKRQQNEQKWAWEKLGWLRVEESLLVKEKRLLRKQQSADHLKRELQQKEKDWKEAEGQWEQERERWLRKEKEMRRKTNTSKTNYATQLWDRERQIVLLRKKEAATAKSQRKRLEASEQESLQLKKQLNSTQHEYNALTKFRYALQSELSRTKGELEEIRSSGIAPTKAQVAEGLQKSLEKQKATMERQYSKGIAGMDAKYQAIVKRLEDELQQRESVATEHQARADHLEGEVEELKSTNQSLRLAIQQQTSVAANELAAPVLSQPVIEITNQNPHPEADVDMGTPGSSPQKVRQLGLRRPERLRNLDPIKPQGSPELNREGAMKRDLVSPRTRTLRRRQLNEEEDYEGIAKKARAAGGQGVVRGRFEAVESRKRKEPQTPLPLSSARNPESQEIEMSEAQSSDHEQVDTNMLTDEAQPVHPHQVQTSGTPAQVDMTEGPSRGPPQFQEEEKDKFRLAEFLNLQEVIDSLNKEGVVHDLDRQAEQQPDPDTDELFMNELMESLNQDVWPEQPEEPEQQAGREIYPRSELQNVEEFIESVGQEVSQEESERRAEVEERMEDSDETELPSSEAENYWNEEYKDNQRAAAARGTEHKKEEDKANQRFGAGRTTYSEEDEVDWGDDDLYGNPAEEAMSEPEYSPPPAKVDREPEYSPPPAKVDHVGQDRWHEAPSPPSSPTPKRQKTRRKRPTNDPFFSGEDDDDKPEKHVDKAPSPPPSPKPRRRITRRKLPTMDPFLGD